MNHEALQDVKKRTCWPTLELKQKRVIKQWKHRVKEIETLETFVTFMVADMNPPTRNAQRIVTIPPVLDPIKPIWNYCRYALLPCSYINHDSKGLTVDVWQRAQGDQRKSHLGRATIPLSTLMLPKSSTKNPSVGLEFVKGWYEIYDPQGNSKGQILVGVYPIEDKEEHSMSSQLCPRLRNLLNSDKTIEIEPKLIFAALKPAELRYVPNSEEQ
ncbi:hypothetical protein ACTXT7_014088 [Hymenolepis weldensis]